uniref:Uncharacterized protein n=1 Tax=Anopheles culicifacies TaxID=139723 RepID=A0A182M937_9DIPT
MELKPRPGSPTTVTGSGVIVQSTLSAGSLPDVGTESVGNSSLIAGTGSSSSVSPLASTVGQVGSLSDRKSELYVGTIGSVATTSTTTTSNSCAKLTPSSGHGGGKRSSSIATPVKSSNVSGGSTATGSTSCIPSPILSPPGKIFGRNNNGINVSNALPNRMLEAERQETTFNLNTVGRRNVK